MIEKKDTALEKAVLIGVITKEQDEVKSKEYLDEYSYNRIVIVGVIIFLAIVLPISYHIFK